MAFITVLTTPNATSMRDGSLLIQHYTGLVDVHETKQHLKLQQDVIDACGHVSVMCIMHSDVAGKPNQEIKDETARNTAAQGERLTCTALVIVGSGLTATILRMAVVAYTMLSRAGVRQKIFSNVVEAAAWMRDFPGQDPSLKSLDGQTLERMLGLTKKLAG